MSWFPDSFVPLYAWRVAMVLSLLVVCVLVYRITARLFDPLSAWFAPVLVATSTLVLNRALDVRPDLITTLLWLAALDLVTARACASEARPRGSNHDHGEALQPAGESSAPAGWHWSKLALLGVLLGLMSLNRFKAALCYPFVLGLLAYGSVRERGVRASALPLAREAALVAVFALLPALGYLTYLWASGALETFFAVNAALAGTLRSSLDAAVPRASTFSALVEYDPWLCATVAAGLVLRADHWSRHDTSKNLGVVAIAGLAAASVFLNPAYYAYNLVTLLPLVAPFGGYACARGVRGVAHGVEALRARWRPSARATAWVAPLAALVLLLWPLLSKVDTLYALALLPTNQHQLRLHRYLTQHTKADTHVFAMEGIGLFRPSIFHFRMPAVILPRYRAGEFTLRDELAAHPPELIVKSYRIPGWLTEQDEAFVKRHYVALEDDFLVPGFASHAPGVADFDVLLPGRYEVSSPGACSIDGALRRSGELVELEAGAHRLQSDGTCTLQKYVAPEARALLENPTPIPYLLDPGYVVS